MARKKSTSVASNSHSVRYGACGATYNSADGWKGLGFENSSGHERMFVFPTVSLPWFARCVRNLYGANSFSWEGSGPEPKLVQSLLHLHLSTDHTPTLWWRLWLNSTCRFQVLTWNQPLHMPPFRHRAGQNRAESELFWLRWALSSPCRDSTWALRRKGLICCRAGQGASSQARTQE